MGQDTGQAIQAERSNIVRESPNSPLEPSSSSADLGVQRAPVRGTVEHRGWPGLTTRFQAACSQLHLWFQPVVRWPLGGVIGWDTLPHTDAPGFANVQTLRYAAAFLRRENELGRAIRTAAARALEAMSGRTPFFIGLSPADFLDESLYATDALLTPFAHRVYVDLTDDVREDTVPDLDGRLSELRALGYRVSLDDVALTRSLSERLRRVTPVLAKIDASLVCGAAHNRANATHLSRLLRLLREHDVPTIAKGIENTEDLALLTSLGCSAFQGSWFGAPGPASLD